MRVPTQIIIIHLSIIVGLIGSDSRKNGDGNRSAKVKNETITIEKASNETDSSTLPSTIFHHRQLQTSPNPAAPEKQQTESEIISALSNPLNREKNDTEYGSLQTVKSILDGISSKKSTYHDGVVGNARQDVEKNMTIGNREKMEGTIKRIPVSGEKKALTSVNQTETAILASILKTISVLQSTRERTTKLPFPAVPVSPISQQDRHHREDNGVQLGLEDYSGKDYFYSAVATESLDVNPGPTKSTRVSPTLLQTPTPSVTDTVLSKYGVVLISSYPNRTTSNPLGELRSRRLEHVAPSVHLGRSNKTTNFLANQSTGTRHVLATATPATLTSSGDVDLETFYNNDGVLESFSYSTSWSNYDGLRAVASGEMTKTPAAAGDNKNETFKEIPWPVKKEAVVEGDLIIGGLMMVHEREDTITCGPVMPQGGIQALEAMLYTLDHLNFASDRALLPNITLGAHILDDCDKDTYGLEMAVDFIKGGLMMVHEREDSVTCGPVMPQGGIQALEAMLYTLDRLNFARERLLPNISLGAHILDDCDKDTYGLEMAVDFIKGSISNIDGAEYHCNKTQVRKVISGVVGAASSVTSIQVANLLRLFKIPQVSFFSTSPELSNKQRFEYFTRTIPSDRYQVKAMVDIVRLMGWSYISIIYEESNYGIKAFEELEDLLAEYNICIAVKEKLVKDSGVAAESAYDSIVQKLLTKPRARGCIIFGSDQEVASLMKAVRRSNATGAFSWIGSDGWSARSLVSDGNEAEVEGTLSVQPRANPVRGFKEYFLSLNVENNPRNPWFVEFWEHHFSCRYPNSSETPYNIKYTNKCSGKEKLNEENTVFEDQLQFVSDAVMAFAYAIRDMHRDLCSGKPGLCEAMKPTKGTKLLHYLKKVSFKGLSGDSFHFDINGDGPARYNIIHFKQVLPGKYQWIRVGEYLEGELTLNMSEVQFKLGQPKPPESVCSLPCNLGQAKKYVEGESCCWHCFNCTQYQIRHPEDPTQCVMCPQGAVPDPHHVRCNPIPEEYLQPDSGWAIGAMAFSSTGILVTLFVLGVFVKYNKTPVVRASGRELSYTLLAGILMCYSVTYALVLRPSDIVCGIQRFGAGFCFTVVYAALLTKTNRISRIFNEGKHSAKRPNFISPRSQLIICSFLVGVQVLINGVWMVISPARAIYHYPTREDNLLVCSSYIDASYMIAFTYPIFLIVVCTVYAVLTRKIPEAFNESKHIGFTMYTTCVIWLAFVPLYFGTANHVALRITSMSVTISLSASVTLACLFSPKLYIILIRPERNVRQTMMPMRYSAINKSSATTGSGSMMAAVVVTAATCDQNQKIQKAVTPVDNGTSEMFEKPKVQTKETSTQTTTPQTSNNILNSCSLENLPKINNNCNVNGPIIQNLQNSQIKELTS